MRARVYLAFMELTKCSSNNNDSKIIKDFLDQNENIIILPIDKNKGCALMNKSDYIVKLQEAFNSEKFLKLSKSCLKKNIRDFQNDLNKFKRFLDPEIH